MRRSSVFLLLLFLLFTVVSSVAQQDFVSRYDAFAGYSYLNSPKLSLSQNGFHTQFGVNARSWAALGARLQLFQPAIVRCTPSDLNSTQLAKLAPIAPLLPPGFVIQSPYDATTYTITGGPTVLDPEIQGNNHFRSPLYRSDARERNRKSAQCAHGANRH